MGQPSIQDVGATSAPKPPEHSHRLESAEDRRAPPSQGPGAPHADRVGNARRRKRRKKKNRRAQEKENGERERSGAAGRREIEEVALRAVAATALAPSHRSGNPVDRKRKPVGQGRTEGHNALNALPAEGRCRLNIRRDPQTATRRSFCFWPTGPQAPGPFYGPDPQWRLKSARAKSDVHPGQINS